MPSSESVTPIQVQHEPEQSRYSVTIDGRQAVANYRREGNVIVFTHTEVPPEMSGHGVASALAQRALDDARAAGDQVIPRCSFFAQYMRAHPEYNDLLAHEPARHSAQDPARDAQIPNQ